MSPQPVTDLNDMKIILAVIGASVVVAAHAQSGSSYIIKQRAKELSNQNNVRQGVTPPAPAAPSAPPARAAATIQPGIGRLPADLAAIKANSAVAAEQTKLISQDLTAAAQGATKPAPSSIAKLTTDLAAAVAEKPLTAVERSRLAQDLNAALNSVGVQQLQMQAIIADVQAILQVSGLNRSKAVAVADDVKLIAAEVQKRAAK